MLQSIERTTVALLLGGLVVSLLAAYRLQDFWDWSATDNGVALVAILGAVVTLGPCGAYLRLVRCPRCEQQWRSNAPVDTQSRSALVAPTSWLACCHCGLSFSDLRASAQSDA